MDLSNVMVVFLSLPINCWACFISSFSPAVTLYMQRVRNQGFLLDPQGDCIAPPCAVLFCILFAAKTLRACHQGK